MGHRKRLPPLAPLASTGRLAKLHGRSSEAQLLKRIERDLIAQIGEPSAAEKLLIHSTAILLMRTEVLHQHFMQTGESSAHKDKFLVSLVTVSSANLVKLGLKPPKSVARTLEAYVSATYSEMAVQ